MKKLALVFLLLQPAFLLAAPDKPNPADFTVKVHVVSSGSQIYGDISSCIAYQLLETVIDNQPVELQGGGQQVTLRFPVALSGHGENRGILALGDYPARISLKVHGPKNPNTYDIYKSYDLLMPDGSTRTYTVTRLGPAPSHP
jgi:hypothetical protein